MDYIIKVERKSRKESDEAVFYLVMVKGDEMRLIKCGRKEIKARLRIAPNITCTRYKGKS